MDESAFFQEDAAPDYAKSAFASATKYFDDNGLSRPAPSAFAPARSGDNFTSKYGRGSVLSGNDYQTKLKRLLSNSGFDDSLIF